MTGRVWREYVRLAGITFERNKVKPPLDMKYTADPATQNRDWFEVTKPDKPEKPEPPEAPPPRGGGAPPVV